MKGLASNINNAINDYKSTIHIKNGDVLMASRAASDRTSTINSNADPYITNNSNSQEKTD